MSGGFNLDDYVDVAERIKLFYEKYPDGRLTTIEHDPIEINGKWFIYCKVAALRDPDDPWPSHGLAWEPIPGPTPYTKDSEMMNAQTAAWGRAIVAVGIPSKKIASAQEVQARRNGPEFKAPESVSEKTVTKAQHAKIGAVIKQLHAADPDQDWIAESRAWVGEKFGKKSRAELTTAEAGRLIDYLEGLVEGYGVPFG